MLITTPEVAAALAPRAARRCRTCARCLLAPDAATGDDPRGARARSRVGARRRPASGASSLDAAIARRPRRSTRRAAARRSATIRRSGCSRRARPGAPKAAMHSHRDFAFNTEVYAKRTVGYRETTSRSACRACSSATRPARTCGSRSRSARRSASSASGRPPRASPRAIARYRPTDRHQRADDARQAARSRRRAPRARASRGSICRRVRFHLSAGEALPEPLLRRFVERFGGEVYDGIGSAEMFHIYCSNRPGDVMPGSLGRAVEGYTLKILPEDAEGAGAPALPPGEIGVLWVKGDCVAHGYFQDRDKSWKTFHGHWCRTGDLFHDRRARLPVLQRPRRRSVQGRRRLRRAARGRGLPARPPGGLGRRGDPRRRRGPRSSPRRSSCCAPRRAAGDRRALADELKAHVQARLSKHKYPRWIVFVDDLPKNDRGKVDKKLLVERDRAAS